MGSPPPPCPPGDRRQSFPGVVPPSRLAPYTHTWHSPAAKSPEGRSLPRHWFPPPILVVGAGADRDGRFDRIETETHGQFSDLGQSFQNFGCDPRCRRSSNTQPSTPALP